MYPSSGKRAATTCAISRFSAQRAGELSPDGAHRDGDEPNRSGLNPPAKERGHQVQPSERRALARPGGFDDHEAWVVEGEPLVDLAAEPREPLSHGKFPGDRENLGLAEPTGGT